MTLWRYMRAVRSPADEGSAGDGGGANQAEGEGANDATANQGDGSSLLDYATKGDAGGQGEGVDGSGGEAEGSQDADAAPTTPRYDEKPDWLPAPFYDAKTGEVKLQELAKSQMDLRAQVSKGGDKVPKTADAYKLEGADDDLKAIEGRVLAKGEDGADDPLKSWFRDFCHENKVSAGLAEQMYNGFLKTVGDFLPEPVDEVAEAKAELAKLGPRGQEVVDSTFKFVDHLKNMGVLSDDAYQEVRWLCGTATGLQAFNAIREFYGEQPIPTQIKSEAASGKTAAELRQQMGKVMEKAAQGDATAQREYEDLLGQYEKLFGTDPAGTSVVAS